MPSVLLVFVWVIFAAAFADESNPCGDWVRFKDEKCFKILDDTLRTFDDAAKSCARLGGSATLPTIHSGEEQVTLVEYLFQTQSNANSFWLGAKLEKTVFKWIDGTKLNYANWDSNRGGTNQTNPCVEMESDERFRGKWLDVECVKKNLVVCQKPPVWSSVKIEKELIELRKELKQNLIPIGFLYTELPGEKSPEEIWPWMKWTDVSATYANVFFRVIGDRTASFGHVQSDDSPRITEIKHSAVHGITHPGPDQIELYPNGKWSGRIVSARTHHKIYNDDFYELLEFLTSKTEVRPLNMAVRIWKRTE